MKFRFYLSCLLEYFLLYLFELVAAYFCSSLNLIEFGLILWLVLLLLINPILVWFTVEPLFYRDKTQD